MRATLLSASDAESWQQLVHRQFHQQHRWLAVVGQTYFLRMQKSGDTEASLMTYFSNTERMSSALVFYVTDSNAQENPDIHSYAIYFYSVYPSYPFGNLAENCDLASWAMPI